jgi:peptide deformylase
MSDQQQAAQRENESSAVGEAIAARARGPATEAPGGDDSELEAGPAGEGPGGDDSELEAGPAGEAPRGDDAELDGAEDPDAEKEDPPLDPAAAARRAAALAQIRKFGDPVLRTRARPVERFDQALQDEVAWMGGLMIDAIGVGLAATQVGVLHRVLVYRVQQESPVLALVNPEIEWKGSEQEIMEEGCLSLPAVLVDVERPLHVRVRARDERGEEIVVEATGLEARVIQHEIDHLDGVLVLDRTSREQRKEAMRALREAQEAA